LDFFIGYDLQDVDGTSIGEIADVDLSTENAIFVVNGENDRQLIIPANDELIVEFDLEEKVMVMDLPQGLLDLND
jgi:16S rRNA processing protein RimM